MECLVNSHKDISFAKKEIEYLIERSKRAIHVCEKSASQRSLREVAAATSAEPKKKYERIHGTFGVRALIRLSNSRMPGPSLLKRLQLQLETGKTTRRAKEDLKKAQRAMSAAEDMITQIGESLDMEEEALNWRANQLRRQSAEAFKIMADQKKAILQSQFIKLH